VSPDAKCFDCFSFSDTFVLSTPDDSSASFFQIVVGTAVLAQHLFAMRLPVRGSITLGEAEAIPGTHHLVGRAIVRAARLEKAQNWFEVIIDPDILNEKHRAMLQIPLVGPLVVSYPVPVKEGSGLGGNFTPSTGGSIFPRNMALPACSLNQAIHLRRRNGKTLSPTAGSSGNVS
jgi:hypothetical protein